MNGNQNLDLLNKQYFLDLIVNHSPVAYVIQNKNYDILYSNDYVHMITGYNSEDILNRKCYDLFGNGSICNNCPVKKCIDTGKSERYIKSEISKDGALKYIEIIAVPLTYKNGTPDKVLEIVVDKTEEVLIRKQMEKDFHQTIEMLANIISVKDLYTGNHSQSVKNISLLIAQELNLSDIQQRELEIAASLHDIGKMAISDSIINKAGKLSESEYKIIKTHSIAGERILSSIDSFKNIKIIVRHHHERFDGKGYPDGLKGKEISLEARIIGLADAYDAMTSDRSYKKTMKMEEVIDEIKKCSGTQFDPELVDIFLKIIKTTKINTCKKAT